MELRVIFPRNAAIGALAVRVPPRPVQLSFRILLSVFCIGRFRPILVGSKRQRKMADSQLRARVGKGVRAKSQRPDPEIDEIQSKPPKVYLPCGLC